MQEDVQPPTRSTRHQSQERLLDPKSKPYTLVIVMQEDADHPTESTRQQTGGDAVAASKKPHRQHVQRPIWTAHAGHGGVTKKATMLKVWQAAEIQSDANVLTFLVMFG